MRTVFFILAAVVFVSGPSSSFADIILFQDDFDAPNPGHWTTISSEGEGFQRSAGILIGTGDGAHFRVGGHGFGCFSVQDFCTVYDARLVSGSHYGYQFRLQYVPQSCGASNMAGYVLWYGEGPGLLLEEFEAGVGSNPLAGAAVPEDYNWHTIKVCVDGNRIIVYFDNMATPVIDVMDSTAPWLEGEMQFNVSTEAEFDDFAVTEYSGPTATEQTTWGGLKTLYR